MIATEQLVPYARNARTHPDWQIAQIAASIAEFGFCNPILVGADGVIIAGHGRLLAALQLGLEEVPAIELGHLSEVQRRALVIADNKIAENAGWDEDLLRTELAALQTEGFDINLVGFSEAELDELMAGMDLDTGLPAQLGDPDFVPEPPAGPVSRPGDLWILGEHRVLCGDATLEADAERVCDGPVDACWTDPPYNVDYEDAAGKIANDNMSAGDFRRFLFLAFGAMFKRLKPGGPVYVAHADTEGLAFRAAFRDAGFKLSGCLVWVKPSLVLGRSDYQWRHEPILYGWKPGGPHAWFGGRANTTVFEAVGEKVRAMPDGTVQVDVGDQTIVIRGEGLSLDALEGSVLRFDKPVRNAEHPTMKPVELIGRMLDNSSRPGAVVFDPFGGSGSTLIACAQLGRKARLLELDPRFVDVIVSRWQTFTSRQAVRDDGFRFDDLRDKAAA
jgi:DNA modification methylase